MQLWDTWKIIVGLISYQSEVVHVIIWICTETVIFAWVTKFRTILLAYIEQSGTAIYLVISYFSRSIFGRLKYKIRRFKWANWVIKIHMSDAVCRTFLDLTASLEGSSILIFWLQCLVMSCVSKYKNGN